MTLRTLHTYPDGVELKEPFLSPFVAGDKVIIPKGTYISRMGPKPSGPAGRRMVITVDHVFESYLTTDGRHYPLEPRRASIRWPGSSGYWAEARLTPEVLQINGISEDQLVVNERAIRNARHEIYRLTGIRL